MNGTIYDRFNAVAVRSMQYANQAAWHLRHDYIASEHILIGLIRNRRCPAQRLLTRLGVCRAAIVHELRIHMTIGNDPAVKRRRPISPDARRVVRLAADHADRLSHEFIATEHILLALLADETGLASRTLATLGLVYDDVFAVVASDLGVILGDAQKPEP
ncbi:Negative regulator of genetic competence ClpC/MecB [Planctomycetes bacterium CA13]|uniref:Negative regulator of genetic competence ClpC/MecB n=1 Tax=Novipirellula herctigrandis TaxID=2527986 RepID=A0A5C5YYC4_9BACT|nr:Negative regulator of genetic competence ClpC/MecB [Planctomycetes bacterium CA13]TWT79567.1 Negative regulator of genetic competence ClpC/MecB [Planctomycetes bacterium CA13]